METPTTTDLFTEKSEAYAKYRASYPAEAIDAILAPFKDQRSIQVVDVGAGTGIGSYLMANQGAIVNAIEPNGSMIASAKRHELITYHQSVAEHIPIDSGFADVVTSFQAFQWFDFKKSLKEFNRILKPQGQLALVWNYWDVTDTFTAAYTTLINNAVQKNLSRIEPYNGFTGKVKRQRMRLLWTFKYLPFFTNVQRHKFKLYKNMNLEALVGCAKSQSNIIHNGSVWMELIEEIEKLYNQNASCRLAHNINVFLASPTK
ncbi:MAG TPA: class I SAM-dependent methyltransferase [Balneolaceae bacterium]